MSKGAFTLTRHLVAQAVPQPALGSDFARLMEQLAYAGKAMAREIARAPLVGELGLSGSENVTGDEQKKLDLITNQIIIDAFSDSGVVAAIVSEEMPEPDLLPGGRHAQFIFCTDPLDGSSNTDIDGNVGTIFGIYRRSNPGAEKVVPGDILRKGSEQVAAGYVNYGPSTMLVYTAGDGVNGFTLDENVGEFVLTHANMRCPARGKYYSANVGNYPQWDPKIRKFVDYLTTPDKASGRPYSMRYSGALVGDLHRMLISGGIYFYPGDSKNTNGKLRMLYECAPLAMVTEQAGGRASSGTQRILDIKVEKVHQRAPLAIGSADDVALYEKFCRDGTP
jgi:fructose-1,6-bisphosphatase I